MSCKPAEGVRPVRLWESRMFLPAVFTLALVTRVGAVFYLGNYTNPMQWENGAIAQNIVAGKGFSFDYSEGEISHYYRTTGTSLPTSYQAPFYPYLLAGTEVVGSKLRLVHPFLLLELLQAVVGALTVLGVHAVARRSHLPGRLAAAVVAVYPPLVYISAIEHQVVWIVWFICLTTIALLDFAEDPRVLPAVKLGAVSGLTLLAEPAGIAFLAPAHVWLAFTTPRRLTAVRSVGVSLAVSLLILSPWLVRCYRVHQRLVFVKSSLGFVLWVGNNQVATGVGFSGWDHRPFPISADLQTELNATPNEIDRDRIWLREGVRSALEAPRRTVLLGVKKLLYFWSWQPYHPSGRHWVYLLSIASLLPLAYLGIAVTFLRGERQPITYIMFISYSVVYTITYVGWRYRAPLEPYLIAFAAAALVWIRDKFGSARLVARSGDGMFARES